MNTAGMMSRLLLVAGAWVHTVHLLNLQSTPANSPKLLKATLRV